MTIAAVAERCLELAVRRITGNSTWQALERAGVTRTAVPEDAAVTRLRERGPTVAASPGVVFRETMHGVVDGRAVMMKLAGRISDLARFLRDPVHPVALTGTVHVAGVTRHPAVTRHGDLHLLAPAATDGARSMDYLVRFSDDEDRRWALRGHKDVRRHPGTNLWRAVTVLRTTLEVEGEEAGPGGRLAISVWGALRVVASIRRTGLTRGPTAVTTARAMRTTARFALFFVASVVDASRPRRPAPATR